MKTTAEEIDPSHNLSSRKIMSAVFSKIPLSVLSKLTRTSLIIPYYHMISDEEVSHVKHLYRYKTTKEFEEDLDFLLKNYLPLDLRELLNVIKAGRPLPKRAFLLTFDDGFREMSEVVAPILLKKGVNATFFVNSAFTDNKEWCYLNKASLIVAQLPKNGSAALEEKLSGLLRSGGIEYKDIESGILSIRYQKKGLIDEIGMVMDVDFGEYLSVNEPYLTTDQINKLIKTGFSIGAHSIDHPLYSSLSLDDQVHQTIESATFVRERFHLNYGIFAFPHNDDHVSREFFARISKSGLVDLSFGTSGLIEDCVPNHLQRFSLEKPIDTAHRIIAFQYAKKIKRVIMKGPTILRK